MGCRCDDITECNKKINAIKNAQRYLKRCDEPQDEIEYQISLADREVYALTQSMILKEDNENLMYPLDDGLAATVKEAAKIMEERIADLEEDLERYKDEDDRYHDDDDD